jgi:hypothetical protein
VDDLIAGVLGLGVVLWPPYWWTMLGVVSANSAGL